MAIQDFLLRLRQEGAEQVAGGFSTVQASVVTLNQGLDLVQKGFSALTGVASTLFDTLQAGGADISLARSFDTLRESTGATALTLEGLQAATLNTVTATDLMTQANKALVLGLPGNELEEMYAQTVQVARAMGVDAKQAIESVTQGIAGQRSRMLQQIGVVVDSRKVFEDYAKQLGKTTAELTEQERRSAFTAAAMEALRKKSTEVADVQLNAADTAKQLATRFQDLISDFQVGVSKSEALRDAFSDMGLQLDNLDFESVGKAVGDMAAKVIEATNNFIELLGILRLVERKQKDILELRAPEVMKAQAAAQKELSTNLEYQLTLVDKELAQIKTRDQFLERGQDLLKQREKLQRDLLKTELELSAAGVQTGKTYAIELPGALDKSKNKIDELTDGIDELTESQKKAAERVAKLREEFQKLNDNRTMRDFERALKSSVEQLDATSFQNISAQIEVQFRAVKWQELKDKFGDAVRESELLEELNRTTDEYMTQWREAWRVNAQETAQKQAEEMKKAQEDAARELQRQQEQAFRNSVDFFEDILIGAVEGNIEDVFKNMLTRAAIKFGAEILASLTGGFAGLQSIGLAGPGSFLGNLGGLGGAGAGAFLGGGAGGAGLGAAVNGIGPVANGAAYGNAIGGGGFAAALPGIAGGAAILGTAWAGNQFLQDIMSGNTPSFLNQAILAPVTGGLSFLGGLGGAFGSGKDSEQIRRDEIRQMLVEAGILSNDLGNRPHSFSLFGGGVASLSPGGGRDTFQGGEGLGTFGFGQLLSLASLGEVDDHLSNMFAHALAEAENFNAAALTATNLLSQMGFDAGSAETMILQMAAQGRISLEQMNRLLDASSQLISGDLQGSIADVQGGFELLGDTAGGPLTDQIKALEIAFNELRQSGVQDSQALLSAFRDRLSPEGQRAIEQLVSAGITQFTDFATLSNDQLRLVLNLIGEITGGMREAGDSAAEAGRQFDNAARNVILPSIAEMQREVDELNERLNVTVNIFGKVKGQITGTGPGVQ